VALHAERDGQHFQLVRLVIDDQNFEFSHHAKTSSGPEKTPLARPAASC
jgi:hypothetical protein